MYPLIFGPLMFGSLVFGVSFGSTAGGGGEPSGHALEGEGALLLVGTN